MIGERDALLERSKAAGPLEAMKQKKFQRVRAAMKGGRGLT